ncbi:MAG: NIPSNAP family containing protein [Acidobacteria bacterium]|nr:MAG: NIPSNAP family containing protein [Acidobacteriota bacterium]
MKRRDFFASTLAASAGLASAHAVGAEENKAPCDYYELRFYQLTNGSKVKLMHDHLHEAAIPALNRIGISPVGVFNTVVGPISPSLYVLLPHRSLESVATLEGRLRADAEFVKNGAEFLNAPASDPAYIRYESSLMKAFDCHPRITAPPKGRRIFELRTYESSSKNYNLNKVEMFCSGEVEIFIRSGFHPVFFGEKLIGGRMPNLTYMLSIGSIEEREKAWQAFSADPQWKALTASPKFSSGPNVVNITNSILAPAPYSQV